ncbi:helix-turn-helix protein [Cohnella sp. SGD-V74]|uniref:helix-turn-helix domain-containing protein n=1 Tax=unclassified Cohnella TaxID=2636738 RepID=UPI000D48A7F2|nr:MULTISPECIES: helix-turn-helix domain-containing protein [unclassified Cohnella]PRX73663.1 helix-turn-helix protein [Cohnella sp. SGD-V74]
MSHKPYMDIPYALADADELPECRFRSIWKVQANDAYQVRQPSGFPDSGMFVTFAGQGRLQLPSGTRDLTAGTFFIVDKNVPCSYRCMNDDWKFYFIDYRDAGMARHLELPAGETATTAKMPEIVRLCERLIDSLIVRPAGYRYGVHLHLQELLLLLARERYDSRVTRYPELDEVLHLMHRNIGMTLRVEEAVQRTGLSRTAFFQRFREMTGTSPTRYMLELKLASAKVSLETTSLSVKEIADALGFYDEFHFSRTFKRHYGVSPRAYRQDGPD